mmetsp:Transcript_72/g.223  ORF Transcript_72/g.223 Transcript_72/m.223 type:complete len:258 (-) Transcript_72:359-1132(-)
MRNRNTHQRTRTPHRGKTLIAVSSHHHGFFSCDHMVRSCGKRMYKIAARMQIQGAQTSPVQHLNGGAVILLSFTFTSTVSMSVSFRTSRTSSIDVSITASRPRTTAPGMSGSTSSFLTYAVSLGIARTMPSSMRTNAAARASCSAAVRILPAAAVAMLAPFSTAALLFAVAAATVADATGICFAAACAAESAPFDAASAAETAPFDAASAAEAAPFDAASLAEAVLLDATDAVFDASSFPLLEMDVAKFFIDRGYGR